jgi:hypothetical protein
MKTDIAKHVNSVYLRVPPEPLKETLPQSG